MSAQLDAISPAERARREVRHGFSLPAYYYQSEERYRQDVEVMRERCWFLVGHLSQIPRGGDYFLFDFADESIIVIRADDGRPRAFYNVCRHRGSRVCLERHGHANRLVCPYHAWTYASDGRLIGGHDMPSWFDKNEYGLKPCHIDTIDGLIFVNLSSAAKPPSFAAFVSRIKPFIEPYQLANTKIIGQELLPCAANWKLVLENFAECYHCTNAHRTYARSHSLATMMYFDNHNGDLGGGQSWQERVKNSGLYVEPLLEDPSQFDFQNGLRIEIGKGSVSGGLDGKPQAPKLGRITEWSGTWTAALFNPYCQMGCYDDHAVLFTFVPRGPKLTDCIMTWLVREDAVEGRDYQAESIKKMWQVTLAEDKIICANNQLGVSSTAYQPGPYSNSEPRAAEMVEWYLRHFVDRES